MNACLLFKGSFAVIKPERRSHTGSYTSVSLLGYSSARMALRPGVVNVSVGCMDDNSWFTPGVVVYAKDRAPWDQTSTTVPNYERMPPS